MHRLSIAVAAVCTGLLAAVPSSARQADYAGVWNVLITTSKGECDQAFRYSVIIAPDGTISYGGASGFTADGRVEANGAVWVRIARGGDAAEGHGRLSSRSGGGTWTAPSGGCSGAWRAEKR
jgi:hypothetical protein